MYKYSNSEKYVILVSWFQCLEFWEACLDGDVETVLSCLSAGVSVDVATPVS